MTIGQRIKTTREELGVSQVDLATACGITKQNLYKYENNIITNIPSDKIECLADALNVSPAYLMGWDEDPRLKPPVITEDIVTFPVIGEIAAGYDHVAEEDWSGETVNIPTSYLHGRNRDEFFVLTVKGDSMYPAYMDGDKVLILRQTTLNRSGEIGAVIYDSNLASLKKIEYVMGEDWMKMIPLNPNYPPITIKGADLERCRVLGIPKLLVREIE